MSLDEEILRIAQRFVRCCSVDEGSLDNLSLRCRTLKGIRTRKLHVETKE